MADTGALAGTPAAPSMSTSRRLWNILGGSGGNLVEWFDWFAYGAFSIYFASVFFPEGDQTTQFLQAAVVFGVGFIARPLGAWLMGAYADRAGRRAALTLSVSMMCFGSLMIAVTPGAAQIGLAAPVILTLARIIQGLSLGGEYGASATYVSEMATSRSRGFWSGVLYVTLVAGQLLAVMLLLVLQAVMSEEALQTWGWRIPFFVGAGLAIVVYFMRRGMHETAEFSSVADQAHRGRASLLFLKYPRETAMVLAVSAAGNVGFYIYTTYMQKFLINSAAGPAGEGFSRQDASAVMTTVLFFFMLLQPFAGALSDWVGRRKVLCASFLGSALLALPIYEAILGATSTGQAILLCSIPLVVMSGYTSISAIFKAELFPAHVRALGVAVPYALAQAIFGGNAEQTALRFKQAGNEGGFYIVLAVLMGIAFLVCVIMGDTRKKSLIADA